MRALRFLREMTELAIGVLIVLFVLGLALMVVTALFRYL